MTEAKNTWDKMEIEGRTVRGGGGGDRIKGPSKSKDEVKAGNYKAY